MHFTTIEFFLYICFSCKQKQYSTITDFSLCKTRYTGPQNEHIHWKSSSAATTTAVHTRIKNENTQKYTSFCLEDLEPDEDDARTCGVQKTMERRLRRLSSSWCFSIYNAPHLVSSYLIISVNTNFLSHTGCNKNPGRYFMGVYYASK